MRVWIALLGMFCLSSTSVADEPAFQFSKKLQIPAREQEELVAVELDRDVFASTHNGLPDLRIVDSEDNAVSFLIRKAVTTKEQTVRRTWVPDEMTARPLNDGGLEIVVHLDEKAPEPNGLRLVSRLKNFEHRVRVFTSEGGEPWEPVGDEAVLFDYSRYMDVRNDSIVFPVTSRRHFRIVIDDVTSEQELALKELTLRLRGGEQAERVERTTIERRPFRVERVEFFKEARKQRVTGDEKHEYAIAGIRIEENKDAQQTLVFVDAARQPLTSLELVTPDRNFSRHAAVQVLETEGVRSNWKTIGQETVARIDFKDLAREQLAISFPETRDTGYRIVIDNRDSRPLEFTGVTAEGNVYELVFLAAPDEPYRLLYGADETTAPRYDTAAIQALLSEGFPPTEGKLMEQTAGPGSGRPPAFRWGRLLEDARLLVGVIVVLVIVLAWTLYRTSRRLDQIGE